MTKINIMTVFIEHSIVLEIISYFIAIENHQNNFFEANQEVLPVKILIRNEYTIQPSAV